MLRKARTTVAIVITAIVVIAALGALTYYVLSKHYATTPTSTRLTPPKTAASTASVRAKSTARAAVKYVIITDATGRRVKVPVPVKKVISLYRLAPPFLYLLGVGDKFYKGWSWGCPFYSLIDPKFREKVSMARKLNVEEIVKIKPQLILVSIWDRNSRVVKQLEGLGLPVVCVNLENISAIYNTILTLGKVFQKEGYAEEVVNYYKAQVARVSDVLKKVSAERKPRVLILYYSGKHHSFRTFGGDMFQSRLIELAGGVSVSENLSGKKNIDVEQVAKWNPDIILIIQYGRPGSEIKKLILSDPAWRKIKAVREGKVYVVPYDGENWIDPCPKWVLGLYWMAKLFHPQAFKNVNITKIANDFYEKFFGLSIKEVKISGDLNAVTKG